MQKPIMVDEDTHKKLKDIKEKGVTFQGLILRMYNVYMEHLKK